MVKDDDYGVIAVQPCLVCCFAGLADMVATENFRSNQLAETAGVVDVLALTQTWGYGSRTSGSDHVDRFQSVMIDLT